jgi:hypothetical protein
MITVKSMMDQWEILLINFHKEKDNKSKIQNKDHHKKQKLERDVSNNVWFVTLLLA